MANVLFFVSSGIMLIGVWILSKAIGTQSDGGALSVLGSLQLYEALILGALYLFRKKFGKVHKELLILSLAFLWDPSLQSESLSTRDWGPIYSLILYALFLAKAGFIEEFLPRKLNLEYKILGAVGMAGVIFLPHLQDHMFHSAVHSKLYVFGQGRFGVLALFVLGLIAAFRLITNDLLNKGKETLESLKKLAPIGLASAVMFTLHLVCALSTLQPKFFVGLLPLFVFAIALAGSRKREIMIPAALGLAFFPQTCLVYVLFAIVCVTHAIIKQDRNYMVGAAFGLYALAFFSEFSYDTFGQMPVAMLDAIRVTIVLASLFSCYRGRWFLPAIFPLMVGYQARIISKIIEFFMDIEIGQIGVGIGLIVAAFSVFGLGLFWSLQNPQVAENKEEKEIQPKTTYDTKVS